MEAPMRPTRFIAKKRRVGDGIWELDMAEGNNAQASCGNIQDTILSDYLAIGKSQEY